MDKSIEKTGLPGSSARVLRLDMQRLSDYKWAAVELVQILTEWDGIMAAQVSFVGAAAPAALLASNGERLMLQKVKSANVTLAVAEMREKNHD